MIARRLILGAAIAAGVLGVAPKVAAQGYPEKPIKLIVPFPAGGPIDTMARFMTQALDTRLSQSIVIENRPGGGATIATRFVAASPPDGYTLLFGSSGSLAVAPALYSRLRPGHVVWAGCPGCDHAAVEGDPARHCRQHCCDSGRQRRCATPEPT